MTFFLSLRRFSRKEARLARPPSLPPPQPQGSYSPYRFELNTRVMICSDFTPEGCPQEAIGNKQRKRITKYFFNHTSRKPGS